MLKHVECVQEAILKESFKKSLGALLIEEVHLCRASDTSRSNHFLMSEECCSIKMIEQLLKIPYQ